MAIDQKGKCANWTNVKNDKSSLIQNIGGEFLRINGNFLSYIAMFINTESLNLMAKIQCSGL
jgi:hypothetical protein